ncbi:MAG: PKD domain-containing protein [Saprospiraceae bacterium]|nr:PKD domain-containing protein [Saprospiraceae bacterium]
MKRSIFFITTLILMTNFTFGQGNGKISGPRETCVGCQTYVINANNFPLSEVSLVAFDLDSPQNSCAQVTQFGNEAIFNVCFGCPGQYMLFANYNDPNGNLGSDSLLVYVFPNLDIKIQATDSLQCIETPTGQGCQPVCPGYSETYYVNVIPGSTIAWNVTGAADWAANGNKVNITWGDQGFGYISAFSQAEGSACFGEASYCVEMTKTEEIDFTMPGNQFCVGENIPFEPTNLSGVSYEWNFGNGVTSSEIKPIVAYDVPGTYTISLSMTTDCGCKSGINKEIIVRDKFMPVINCQSTICEYTSQRYETDADCGQFYWKVIGDGIITDGGGVSDRFISIDWGKGPAGYVELEVSSCNFDLCPKKAIFEIPIISNLAELTGDAVACKNSYHSYSIQKYNATAYQWNVIGGTITAGQGSHTIIVEWGNGDQGRIEVSYDNCYLRCEGQDDMTVVLSTGYELRVADTQLCQGEIFNATTVNEEQIPVSVELWVIRDKDGTLLKSATNVSSLTYEVPSGVDRFEVTTTSASRCHPVKSQWVEVLPKSKSPGKITGELSICKNTAYAYAAISDLANASFHWRITDGGLISEQNGKNIVVTWNSEGPYKLEVSQTDLSGAFCPSNAYAVSPVKVSNVNISGVDESCIYDKYEISATHYEGMNYNWKIIPEDGTTWLKNDTSETSLTWSKEGSYLIQLTTCAGTVNKLVQVNPLPDPNVAFPPTLCEGTTALISTNMPAASTIWYNENDQQIAVGPTAVLPAGTYLAGVTDAKGCSQKKPFTITQLPKPNIYLSSPEPTAVCLSSPNPSFPLLVANDAEDGYKYAWYYNDLATGATTPTWQSTATGKYKVEITDEFGCTNSSNTLVVYDRCDPNDPGNPGGNPSPCISTLGTIGLSYTNSDCNTFQFTSTATNFIMDSHQWHFDDIYAQNNYSTDANPVHDFSRAGYYDVTYAVAVDDANNPGGTCKKFQQAKIAIDLAAAFEHTLGCQQQEIQFFDRSTFIPGKDITSWTWNFGDPASGMDNTSSAADPTHIFHSEGSYTITLRISNGNCTDEITKTLTLHPQPVANILSGTAVCENAATQIYLDKTDGLYRTDWTFGEPSSGSNNTFSGKLAYHVYAAAGLFTVTASVTSNFGCTAEFSNDIRIFANTLSGNITSSLGSSFCENVPTTLNAPFGGTQWQWSTGATAQTIETNITGIYTVTVTDSHGCNFTPAGTPLTIHQLPASYLRSTVVEGEMSIVSFEETITFCEGKDLYLDAVVKNTWSYQWQNNANSSGLAFSAVYQNRLSAGPYAFTVTITDVTTGCKNTFGPLQVTVNGLPAQTVIVADTPGILCEGLNHQISVASPLPGINYLWNTGKSGTSISSASSGNYFVVAKDGQGCKSESNVIEIKAGPDISFIPSGCFERCAPDTLCFPAITNVVSYQWLYNGVDIAAAQGGNDPYIQLSQSGMYQVELIGSNSCTSTSDLLNLTLIPATGTVNGAVYVDVNTNGIIDAADTLSSGTVVQLGTWTATTANGLFQFSNVPAGSHIVNFDTNTLPAGAKPLIDSTLATIITCDDTTSVALLIGIDCISSTRYEEKNICHGDSIYLGSHYYYADATVVKVKILAGGCLDSTIYQLRFGTAAVFELIRELPCPELANGSLKIISANLSDYQVYLNGVANDATDGKIDELKAGDYLISLVDDKGCRTEQEIKLEDKAKVNFELTSEDIGCQKGYADLDVILHNYTEDAVTIKWNNTITEKSLKAYKAGFYEVSIYNGCETVKAGVEITSIAGAHDTRAYIVCSGNVLPLLGQTFSNDTVFHLLSPNENGCTDTTTYKLSFSPRFDYALDIKSSCPGLPDGQVAIEMFSPGIFSYAINGQPVIIQDGVIAGLYYGTYQIKIKDDAGCEENKTLDVPVREKVLYNIQFENITCFKGYAELGIQLENYAEEEVSFMWSSGEQGASIKTSQSGTYNVTISNGCESTEEKFEVTDTDDKPSFLLPNILNLATGNENAIIDLQQTEFQGSKVNDFRVYNRAGLLVFSDQNADLIWDGKLGTAPLPAGVYVYTIDADVDVCGTVKKVHKAGTITIIH